MKVLVFGADGFIGRNVSNELSKSHRVYGSSRGDIAPNKGDIIRADLLNQDSIRRVLEQVKPEVVVNCAGVVGAGMDTDLNVLFTKNILDQVSCVDGIKKVVISGSAGVYGRVAPESIPVSEDAPLNADSGYGLSKLKEERLALDYRAKDIGVVVLRIFNPIGKKMADRFLIMGLLRQIQEYKLGSRGAIELSRLDSKRDYVAVNDVAAAFRVVIEGNPKQRVYNVGSGRSTTNGELLRMALDSSKLDDRPGIIETSANAEPLVAIQADISRITSEFDWSPMHNIEDVIKEICNDESQK